MNSINNEWPTWLRDIDSLIAVHSHFVILGNIRDWYRLPLETNPLVPNAAVAIQAALAFSGFDVMLLHDIVSGYSIQTIDGDTEAGWGSVRSVVDIDLRSSDSRDLSILGTVISKLGNSNVRRLALILNDASRLINRVEQLDQAELELFRVASNASREAKRPLINNSKRYVFNPVFWLVDREHDLPAWLTAANPGIHSISIPFPDLSERNAVAAMLIGQPNNNVDLDKVTNELAAGTDGLGVSSLVHILNLCPDQNIDLENIDDAIRIYKVGAAESPWRKGEVARR